MNDSAPTPSLTFIGRIRTPFATGAECPRFGDESMAEGLVEIFAPFAAGLHSIVPGQEVSLLTWLHQADRSVLQTHPRGDLSRPQRGVFNTRSPARPNPLGLHDVRVLEVYSPEPDGSVRLRVDRVDMMDGTPLVDIKATFNQRGSASACPPAEPAPTADDLLLPQMEAIMAACRDGWQRGLFSGFNGNVSMRCGSSCLITRTGCAKSALGRIDFSLLDIATGTRLAGPPASSEAGMHCAVYRRMPKVDCVAHTHPVHLLALSLTNHPLFSEQEEDLFERRQIIGRLGWVKDYPPGSDELAEAVAATAVRFPAVWMQRHGLTTCAANPHAALALAEELDHQARIELLCLRNKDR